MADPNLNEITTTTLRNRKMDDDKYNVEIEPAPKDSQGPSGAIPIPTKPTRENQGTGFRHNVRDGKLRNSGVAGAHRIGKRK